MDFPVRTLTRPEWPPLLGEMTDPPKQLFSRGTLDLGEKKILTVVGSRKASNYGRDVARELIKGLSGYPIVVVSGLAIGIDAITHEAALDAGLTTIAVPGSGIDDSVLYPARHRHLARRILESGGCLLSEFEPTFRATTWSFPARNRIMAGMSHAVLVVEAELRSGTLITSRLATEYNRDVLTVPGSIFSSLSDGPHMLIRLGATPVTTSTELLEALGYTRVEPEAVPLPLLSPEEARIYEILDTPLSRDEIVRKSGLDTATGSVIISLLELKGVLVESGGTVRRAR